VIYVVYPWFGSQHGPELPTAEHGVGSLQRIDRPAPGLPQTAASGECVGRLLDAMVAGGAPIPVDAQAGGRRQGNVAVDHLLGAVD